MIATIIGVGLLGGSMALSLKEKQFVEKVIGVDNNEANIQKAMELGLIDEAIELNKAIAVSDLIILAIPVDSMLKLLPDILNMVDQQVVMDVGSTKEKLLKEVCGHPNRKRFVATHPMAGTEYSGPAAAMSNLFDHKICVLCNVEQSDLDALETVKKLYEVLQMPLVYMDCAAHDIHAAYVSHISHITSFALALTVLEKEKEEAAIFELASAGFESTVRLAKSSPDMWVPIFRQNRENILDVLEEHIHQLSKMKDLLEKEDYQTFYQLIKQSNTIRKILK